MSGRLGGLATVITGAARGIGRAYAARFVEEGAGVVVTDILPLEGTVAKIGREVAGIQADVRSRAGAQSVIATTLDRFGRIDVLVNNAAYYGGMRLAPFDEIPEGEWDLAMEVNVKGVWNMCAAAAGPMRERGSGTIINVTSNVVFMGKPHFLHYVTSKGAVWSMTSALSRELAGTGITVNAIAPGYTITDATRELTDPQEVERLEDEILRAQSVKRLMRPEDLVGAVVFLASPDARFVTGQTLTVDGGVIVG